MRLMIGLLALTLSSVALADAPATAPASITKGMTLADAQKIAKCLAKLEREDDNGNKLYTIQVWDESDDYDEVQKSYNLTVRSDVIIRFDVDVIHHPRQPVGVDKSILKTGNHWYVVNGLNPPPNNGGLHTRRKLQAKTLADAIKAFTDKGYTKVNAHLATKQEQQ